MNKWLDKYDILDEADADTLEAEAAVHEFQNKLSREKAEQLTHSNYIKSKAIEAAAHHLLGIRAAHASGSMSAAQQHGKMYHAAMVAAGLDPFGEVPPEIKDCVQGLTESLYSYKPHASDQFFMGSEIKADETDKRIADGLERINKLKELLKD